MIIVHWIRSRSSVSGPRIFFSHLKMKDLLEAALGMTLAFIAYTLMARISYALVLVFNLFSLAVIDIAFEKGEVCGASFGAVCGLIQDSFSAGVYGVAGIAKTLVGYAAGMISRKMNVQSLPRKCMLVVFLIAAELIMWAVLSRVIFGEHVNTGRGLLFFQPLGTALLGSVLFPLTHRLRRLHAEER